MLISQTSQASRLLVSPVVALAAVAWLVLGGAAAQANPVPFAPNLVIGSNVFGQGSDPNDPVFQAPVDYQLGTIGEFYRASSDGSEPVHFSINGCLLAAGGTTCQPGIAAGQAYSIVAEISLVSVDNPIPPGGMYLVLGGVFPTPAYAADAVRAYASHTEQIPGFTFTPVSTLSRVALSGVTNYYLGFFFADANASVTLRIDVDAMLPGGTPVLMTSFAYVPEPATALMLGLGCLGLAAYRRRG